MDFVHRLLGRKTDDTSKTTPPLSQPAAESQASESGETTAKVDDAPARQRTPHRSDPDLSEATLWYDPPGTPETLAQREEAGGQTMPYCGGLRVGYASDVGQLRGHNEDTLVAFQGVQQGYNTVDPFGFFVVTDGMGGHQAGEIASSLAAQLVTQRVLNSIYLPFLLDEAPGANMDPLTEVLERAVARANSQVHERVPGGGTTLTCALILGRRAYIAHVGDSRAYLLTDRGMQCLTRDHSFVGRLIELGELSPEEAAVHPQRHVLYRAVGQGDKLDIDTYQQSLPPGSRLLLCSDGLSGVVPEQEMGQIIAAAATPQEACQRLVEAANLAGGPDNITAVLIETPLD